MSIRIPDSYIRCLKSIRVTLCPLCRVPYDPREIKKLHVDKYTGDGYDNAAKEETRMLRATVVGFEEGVTEHVIDELLVVAQEWLLEGEVTRSVRPHYAVLCYIISLPHSLVLFEARRYRPCATHFSGIKQCCIKNTTMMKCSETCNTNSTWPLILCKKLN